MQHQQFGAAAHRLRLHTIPQPIPKHRPPRSTAATNSGARGPRPTPALLTERAETSQSGGLCLSRTRNFAAFSKYDHRQRQRRNSSLRDHGAPGLRRDASASGLRDDVNANGRCPTKPVLTVACNISSQVIADPHSGATGFGRRGPALGHCDLVGEPMPLMSRQAPSKSAPNQREMFASW